MKKISVILGISFFCIVCLMDCKKGGGGGGTTEEENLSIGVDPDPGTLVTALGVTYDFRVVIKSKMPSGGVKIDISCTKDLDNSVVFSQSVNSSTTPVNVNVTNLVSGVLCTVKVTVTSVGKPSNTASLVFKVSRK